MKHRNGIIKPIPPVITYKPAGKLLQSTSNKKQGGLPETSLRKTIETPMLWRFPVHARGDIYTVFHEESDFQVENSQFRQPGPTIWKNLIKTIYF